MSRYLKMRLMNRLGLTNQEKKIELCKDLQFDDLIITLLAKTHTQDKRYI